MVEKAKRRLCDIQFNEIDDRVHNFISAMKEKLDDVDAEMQIGFEKCRGRACMPGQEVQDEIQHDVRQRFRVEDFRRVISEKSTVFKNMFNAWLSFVI